MAGRDTAIGTRTGRGPNTSNMQGTAKSRLAFVITFFTGGLPSNSMLPKTVRKNFCARITPFIPSSTPYCDTPANLGKVFNQICQFSQQHRGKHRCIWSCPSLSDQPEYMLNDLSPCATEPKFAPAKHDTIHSHTQPDHRRTIYLLTFHPASMAPPDEKRRDCGIWQG